jgi:hypothetical protein
MFGFTVGSQQTLHEALIEVPLWSVWGNSWCYQALLDTSEEPEEKSRRKHVWFYHGFPTGTSRGTISTPIVKCLGELLVLLSFTQRQSRNIRVDQCKPYLVSLWISYKHFTRHSCKRHW